MKLKLLIMFSIMPALLLAQELSPVVMSSSGGGGSNTSASLCWTVGELAVETLQATGASLGQGFHQVQIVVVSGIEDENLVKMYDLQVFPNPVMRMVTVSAKENPGGLEISMYDLQGRQVFHDVFTGSLYSLDMKSMKPATYVLKITDGENKPIKSYHIVKN
ncbi:MAG: T9SS type A sorting domain-containing protein [Bacteroidales bacterium]|nr:T9SS type A sorting domain-containing protein [Bacteroidales bacterium]